jgi:predicted enzyme related to lactoylglutathione lyase
MSHIQIGAVIYAKNLAQLAKFYENVTGLEVRETNKNYTRLESNSFQLVVLQAPKHIASTIVISEPPVRRENTPIKLVFFVKRISDAREKVIALGGELNTSEKEWKFGEHMVCDGHDPEGNVFQLRALSGRIHR